MWEETRDDLHDELDTFRTNFSVKLDELETRLNFLLPVLNPNGTPREGNSADPSSASLASVTSVAGQDSNFSIDDFAAMFAEKPEDAVIGLIGYISDRLSQRVNTKRFIEKANSQYVDTSFQRVSTHLTALISQKVLAHHDKIESEMAAVISEVDSLRDQIVHQLADIRNLIQECRIIIDEKEREKEFVASYLSDQQRGRLTLKTGPPRRPLVPLLRARQNVQDGSVQVSLALRGRPTKQAV
jgi:hypothetical protein